MREKLHSFLIHGQQECQPFLNMQTQISHSTLSFNSEKLEKLIEDLENQFPPQTIHPKEEINSIMYKAGQQSVVEYVKQSLE